MRKNRNLLLIPVIIAAVIMALPLLWMLLTSLKGNEEIVSGIPSMLPQTVTLEQYDAVLFQDVPFFTLLKNSLIVACGSSLIAILFGNLAAYGFSRYMPKHGNGILTLFLIAQLFPSVMLTVPFYSLMADAKLLNSYFSLIVANTSLALPYATYMMKGYYDNLPKDLENAACLDGCTRFQAYYRICVPLCSTGSIATFFMAFIISWDEYVLALSLVTKEHLTTLPIGIVKAFVGQFSIRWGELMASGVLLAVPPLVIFTLLNKYFVAGQVSGAIKE